MDHVGAVGGRVVGVLVGLDEDRGDADRDGGTRHHRGELALAPGGGALAARLLDRVGRVHHHRIAGAGHDRQRPHVGDEGVVAEGDAALAEQETAVAGRGDLGRDVGHVPRSEELALLDVDRGTGLACGQEEVGLARQEGGDLEHVDRLGGRGAVGGGVDVGQHRAADAGADLREDAQALVHAEPARRRDRRAVGLVVGALEDQAGAIGRAGAGEGLGDHQRVVEALELAGAGDQCQRVAIGDGEGADLDGQGFGHRGASLGRPR